MRKITQQAAAAFEAGKYFRSGNTTVSIHAGEFRDAIILSLHGHAIAKRYPDGSLFVSSAGWETATTKERLNGLSSVQVFQKKGRWYLNGEIWNNTSQFKLVKQA